MTSQSHPIISHRITVQSPAAQRVLIVDDEPAILFAYRKLIEKEGLGVDISTCLETALSYIGSCRYLAVIADMRLTGSDNEDGLEFLRVLRLACPATRTIIATGNGSVEMEAAARALGVTYYFEKPVQPAVIMSALKSFSRPPPAECRPGNGPCDARP